MKLLDKLFWIVTGSVTAVGLLAVILGWQAGGRWWAGTSRWFAVEETAPQTDTPTLIVQRLQGASALTTAIYSMETIVPTTQDRVWGDVVIGTTKLLYIAYGKVEAGIDLSQLQPENVQVTATQVTITLPPPQILDRVIDVERSEVYDYDRGFLNLGPDAAPQLQTLAERETLQKMALAACEQDILGQANQKAQVAITELLTLSGYANVSVQTTAPATCR